MNHYLAILALIQSLTRQVESLELQLVQTLSAQVAMLTPSSRPTSTAVPSTQTFSPQKMSDETVAAASPVASTTISVAFLATSSDEGFVTIKNTSNVAVRVKSLDVDGVLAGFTDGPVYGQGFVYPASVVDAASNAHDVFACDGLGSEGMISLPGGGTIDPCRRRDANLAKNELQPGETMVLRYTGGPTAVTYQPGSIVEVATGNDVEF